MSSPDESNASWAKKGNSIFNYNKRSVGWETCHSLGLAQNFVLRFGGGARRLRFRSAEIIRDLQDRGFDFCALSFASSQDTQRSVLQQAVLLEVELIRPFTSIDVVNRKQSFPSGVCLSFPKVSQGSLKNPNASSYPLRFGVEVENGSLQD